MLLLLLVKGSLVELVLLEFGCGALKLDMALLLVVGVDLLGGIRRVFDVGANLSDTGILLEILRILLERLLVRLAEQVGVSDLHRTRGRDDRWGLGLPVDGLLVQRDLGYTGPSCKGGIAHTLRGPTSKTAGSVVCTLGDVLLRLGGSVVAAGQDILDKLSGRLLLWRGTLR